MDAKKALTVGWITSITFIFGTFIFGQQLVGYSAISQTVSEIGQKGSPLYFPWQLFTIGTSCLLILFAFGLISFAKKRKLTIVPALFILAYGLSQFAMGFFPSPHSLHNIFGLSMIVGYFSPLMFVVCWKNQLGTSFKRLSILAFILMLIGIFLNLTPAFSPNLYSLEYYGIVQRFLLFTFYIYCAFISISTLNSSLTSQGQTEHNNGNRCARQ